MKQEISSEADPFYKLRSLPSRADANSTPRLLIQNSPGHCCKLCDTVSFAVIQIIFPTKHLDPSQDVLRVITRDTFYFLYGELPEDGFTCEIDQGYFPGKKVGVDVQTFSEEALFESSHRLAQAWRNLAFWNRS